MDSWQYEIKLENEWIIILEWMITENYYMNKKLKCTQDWKNYCINMLLDPQLLVVRHKGQQNPLFCFGLFFPWHCVSSNLTWYILQVTREHLVFWGIACFPSRNNCTDPLVQSGHALSVPHPADIIKGLSGRPIAGKVAKMADCFPDVSRETGLLDVQPQCPALSTLK